MPKHDLHIWHISGENLCSDASASPLTSLLKENVQAHFPFHGYIRHVPKSTLRFGARFSSRTALKYVSRAIVIGISENRVAMKLKDFTFTNSQSTLIFHPPFNKWKMLLVKLMNNVNCKMKIEATEGSF